MKRYQLPVNYLDLIVYTGFGYSGRNLILTRSADAVIIICGRIGTLNEFTVAFEDRKPIGVLEESGGMADEIEDIIVKTGKASSTKANPIQLTPEELRGILESNL